MSTYDYGTFDTYSTVDTSGIGALMGGVIIVWLIAMLVALAVSIIGIVGQWKAFKKAGKGGWDALIPIYNTVVCCQITGITPWWVLIYFAGSIVLGIIPVIGSLASVALSIYFLVLLNVSVAKSFGKSDSFAVGLIFLKPFFWFALGGKNAQYVGPTPMNDVVMNFVNEKILNKNSQNVNNMNNGFQQPTNNGFQQPVNNDFQQPVNNQFQQPVNNDAQAKFCTACGYKVTNGERFCPGCGKEII